MSKMLIGKSQNTGRDVYLELPTVMVVTGEPVSGKRFLSRTMMVRKETGRIIVFTNNPDSFHGLDETIVKISEEVDMEIKDRVTVFNFSCFYDKDPNHILDARMNKLGESIQEDDLVIVNDAYPFLIDDVDQKDMVLAIENAWKRGATVLFATTETQALLKKAPEMLSMCEHLFILKQEEKDAIDVAEAFAQERGRYELLRIYNLLDFGQGLLLSRDGTIDFVKVQ